MDNIKDFDRQVSTAVKNDPLTFIAILNDEASKSEKECCLLREAACVIANLLDQLGERVDWDAE